MEGMAQHGAAHLVAVGGRAAVGFAIGGRDVAVETRVDPELLGGLVVRIGSRMLDSSIRTKLQRLELAMKGAG